MSRTSPPLAVRSVAGLPRLPGAAEALARLLAERHAQPFSWGQHDCCLWGADAVAAQVGVDPAAELRGRYSSARQAERVIRQLGGSLRAIASAALGEPLPHAVHACAGDLGLVPWDETGVGTHPALGVCIGEWWAVASAAGISYRPLTQALQSWRVG